MKTIEELEIENKVLKERIVKLEAWMDYYSKKDTARMWMDWANTAPQQHFEIRDKYERSKLPEL